MTDSKEKFNTMIRSWIDKFAHVLQSTDTREFIQVLVLDPFLKHIIGQIFPYMLIAFCLFGAVFIFVILIFVLLLFRSPPPCPFCSVKAAAI